MQFPRSGLGLILALVYVTIAGWLILSQGLFGESFIALILGLPWSLLFAFFEYGGADGILLYMFLLGPLALNAFILYWLGSLLSGKRLPHGKA